MYNIGAVMHWCFDCTNKCHTNYFYICLRSVIWIGLDLENWTHVQLWYRVRDMEGCGQMYGLCTFAKYRGNMFAIGQITVYCNSQDV